MEIPARSSLRLLHLDLDFKTWLACPPSVASARPRVCPGCGAAACPPGAPKCIVGHGLVEREVAGPLAPRAPPSRVVLRLRRFRCLACSAILVVAPRGVLARRRYHAPAIALGLLMFADGNTAVAVRAALCPDTRLGLASRDRWRTLERWCRDARDGALLPGLGPLDRAQSYRQVASRVALALEGRGRTGLGGDRAEAVWQGVLRC